MINLIIGVVFIILLLILLVLEIRSESINKIRLTIELLETFVSIFSLIIPGINEINNSSIVNRLNNAPNINTIGAGLYVEQNINVEGVYNQNDNIAIIEESKNDYGNSQYETVEHYPVGWWDSNGGREEYTVEEINDGILGDKIVFNSISNGKIGHEFNFVAARKNDKENDKNFFNADEIEAEENGIYYVRMYVHNNNPKGYGAVAKNVNVKFDISKTYRVLNDDVQIDGFEEGDECYVAAVNGLIRSTNAFPTEYGDGVKFVSSKPFKLEYIPGTAEYTNTGIATNPYKLSDEIVGNFIPIGYDEMNGLIPGCFEFDSVAMIMVRPMFS